MRTCDPFAVAPRISARDRDERLRLRRPCARRSSPVVGRPLLDGTVIVRNADIGGGENAVCPSSPRVDCLFRSWCSLFAERSSLIKSVGKYSSAGWIFTGISADPASQTRESGEIPCPFPVGQGIDRRDEFAPNSPHRVSLLASSVARRICSSSARPPIASQYPSRRLPSLRSRCNKSTLAAIPTPHPNFGSGTASRSAARQAGSTSSPSDHISHTSSSKRSRPPGDNAQAAPTRVRDTLPAELRPAPPGNRGIR